MKNLTVNLELTIQQTLQQVCSGDISIVSIEYSILEHVLGCVYITHVCVVGRM